MFQLLKPKERNEARRRKEKDQAILVEHVKRVKETGVLKVILFFSKHSDQVKKSKSQLEPSEEKHSAAASGPALVVADPLSNENK